MALYDDLENVAFEDASADLAGVAHGWYVRIRQTCRALLLLHSNDFGDEASPLRRSIIEHAVALYWLVDAKETALDALSRQHQGRTKLTADNLGEGWSITREDLSRILDAEIDPSPQETYLKFTHQCQKYGFSEIMVAWLTETATCHPSLLSAESYVDETDGQRVLLKDSKRFAETDVKLALSIFLLIASGAFNHLLKGQPWTTELEEIERQMTAD
ncbi:DUF5677 domain-containing protein [Kribbella monticola]|uniref:DUF5677 domain-containing protein n=1 Tax=Kribbella monticola TaxID=2185285 RepID=UPI000DD43018|nr:DUF5677 domain-containing protein [Kribbella monticola]